MDERGARRSEAILSAAVIFSVAVVVRIWAAATIPFPRPEDTAYYVAVARHLVEGRGLVADAIWSFATPPLTFPRPAFEVWLPLPSFLAALPMAVLGTSFAAAQWSSVIVGAFVPVLAWRLAADVAAERRLSASRARTVAIGTGLTVAAYLPLVLHSALPDSTMPFTVVALGACLVMTRIAAGRRGLGWLVALGLLLGLAAWTRNEAAWLGLAWLVVAGRLAFPLPDRIRLIAVPAVVALAVFAPWAIRDWIVFGTPLPGQALANALSLDGHDIFAWQDPPTIARYLAAGPATLLGLRVTGVVHDLVDVLVLLGIPVSMIGLVALPWTGGGLRLRPLLLLSVITFAVTSLVFPVSTTWGTFLHAAGPVHVLLAVSAVLALDALIARLGARLGWTRPVAWLAPAATVAASLVFLVALLPVFGSDARRTEARMAAVAAAVEAAGGPGTAADGSPAPVISDTPIWVADAVGRSIALPNEPPASVLDLARHFPGTRLLVLDTGNEGIWPEVLASGVAGAGCFQPLTIRLPADASEAAAVASIRVYRIVCP